MFKKTLLLTGCLLGAMAVSQPCLAKMEEEVKPSRQILVNEVEPSTEEAYLYMDKKSHLYRASDGRYYDFFVDKGDLVIADEARKEVFARLSPVEQGGVAFALKPIYLPEAKAHFVQIIADIGAHAKNCGYWLLGLNQGSWQTYISLDSLAKVGYNIEEWHRIQPILMGNKFYLETGFEYMPKGAKFGYEREYAVDHRYQAVWDSRNKCFNIQNILVKTRKK